VVLRLSSVLQNIVRDMNLDGSFVATKFNWLRMGSGAGYSVPVGSRSVAVCLDGYRETEEWQCLPRTLPKRIILYC